MNKWRHPRVTLGPSMGATFMLTPPRHALFKVLSVTPLSAHSHGFLPYSDLDPHLHIIVEIEIWTGKFWMKTFAMIDSGFSANVIDSHFAAALNIHPIIKSRAINYTMADGETSAGGTVTYDITTKIKIDPYQEVLTLDITKLHSYPIMLGIPWLKRHDPWIQWSQHRITFNSPFCLTHCHLNDAYTATALSEYPTFSPPVTPLPVTPPSVTPPSVTPSLVTTSPASSTTTFKSILKLPHSRTPRKKQKARKVSWSPNIPTTTPPPATLPPPAPSTKRAPKVSLINAVAFHHCLKMPDIQLYRFHISEITSTPAEEGDPDLTKIPPEYHEFAKVFSKEESDKLPEHRPYDHTIPLQEGTAPLFGPIYNLSPAELEVLQKYIDDNLNKRFLCHSQSPAAAPILCVKKPDGTLCLYVNYRGLNRITIKNRYPLPPIGELFGCLGKAKYFSKFDMRDGYNRLRIARGYEWKTAFRCRYGLYEYQLMPFGLCNAHGTFQHFVNDPFREYLDDFMVAYLDDLLIYSNTLKEHKRHVRLVPQRLQDAGLHLKLSKCEFHVQTVSFLGYIISPKGISTDPVKIDSILSWPTPTCVLDIQTFLGFANFYRRFIRNYSRIIVPITNLLKKTVAFSWNTTDRKSTRRLQKAFTTAPILRHFDPSRPAILETDASDYAEGGVVSQYDDEGILHPCAFFSRKFTAAELNYEIYDKEMLAIVDCLTTWRHYFEGSPHQLKVYMDHKNLVWFTETSSLGAKPDALSINYHYQRPSFSVLILMLGLQIKSKPHCPQTPILDHTSLIYT